MTVLVAAFRRLCAAGHTLLVADHDLGLVRAADRITELGPGSGPDGGRVVVAGTVDEIAACAQAPTGAALRGELRRPRPPSTERMRTRRGPRLHDDAPHENAPLELAGVTTHNLRGVAASFPAPGFTVVTGPSGSGKSSLVFDTLLAESQARFADLVSPWARRFLPMRGGAELEAARNLRAAVAVPAQPGRRNPRATVGTVTEIDELLRLLFARAGSRPCPRCGREASGPACACGERLEPLWAADFSPHAERGACPACRGLGFAQVCDPARLVSRPDLPLDGGALDGTRYGAYLGEADGQHVATLRAAAEALGVPVSGPWRDLSPEAQRLAMDGAGERLFEVEWSYRRGKRSGVHRFEARWAGFARLVETEYERVHADERGEELEPLLVDRPCAACGGERLKPAARAVTLAGLRAPEAARQEADALATWLDGLEPGASSAAASHALLAVTNPIRADLRRRVRALCDAGLGYLAPERELATLSGGEAQRVRLAAALGGGLVGVTYVLDEPTQGLHPRDTARLAALLRGLSEAGNAVVVVEHDPDLVGAADHVVELGPGSGPEGGLVVASGPPSALAADPSTYTGRLLARTDPTTRGPRRPLSPGVTIRGASRHTLKDVDVEIPAGGLVVVAGVSGSGKSTLVLEVLAPSLRAAIRGGAPVGCRALDLHAPIEAVLASDQEVLAVGGGSTVATLAGVAEPLRRRFAATPEARARKLTAKAFSSSSPGGRCETCAGRGVVTVAMDLLPDVTVGCEACGGRRFSDDVLACRLDGRSLTDILDAPVGDSRILVRRRPPDRRSPPGPLRDRPLLPAPRPGGRRSLLGREATASAGAAPRRAARGPHRGASRRADARPRVRGRRPAAARARAGSRRKATSSSSWSTTGTSSPRPTGSSSSGRKAARAVAGSSGPESPERRRPSGLAPRVDGTAARQAPSIANGARRIAGTFKARDGRRPAPTDAKPASTVRPVQVATRLRSASSAPVPVNGTGTERAAPPAMISLPGLLLLILIAAVCGAIGSAIGGGSRGGLLVSIVLGFIGALLGSWIARQMNLPEPFVLRAAGQAFPILWSIVGAALFVALLHLFSRRR